MLLVVAGVLGPVLSAALSWALRLTPVSQVGVLGLFSAYLVFVGLVVRRSGAVAVTALISILPGILVDAVSLRLMYPGLDVLGQLVSGLPVRLTSVILTAVALEAVGLLVWRRRSVWLDSLLVVPLMVVRFAVTVVSVASQGHDVFDAYPLLIWPIAALSTYLLAGLVPAAIAGGIRRSGEASRARLAAAADYPYGLSNPNFPPAPGYPAQAIDHPNAITSMVLGTLGLVMLAPLAPFAWAMAGKGRAEAAAVPGRYRQGGALQAGYVLGIIGTVLLIVELLVGIAVVIWQVWLFRDLV